MKIRISNLRLLLRITLGYLVLVWLLALAIVVVFPLLDLREDSVTLAIILLISGLPVVLFLAWTFGIRSRGNSPRPARASAETGATRSRFERPALAVLALAVVSMGVHEILIEGRVGNDAAPAAALAGSGTPASIAPPGSRAQTVSIGIISPKEGSRLAPTGLAHEASIMLAFDRLGAIRTGATEVNIQFIAWNDEGDPALSSELALKLAQEEGVAAILGPVNSSSTEAVLVALRRENIDIPVISSLSTARELIVSGNRDPNFFRLIFDDAGRMAALTRFIEAEKRNQGDQRFLFLYEDDAYGNGLVNDLQGGFYSTNYETVTWCDLVRTDCSGAGCESEDFCSNATLDPALYGPVSTGQLLQPEIARRLDEFDFDTVVLLGTIPGALAISHGIAMLNDRIDHFFVGSNKQLFDEAPIGSVAIGNPVLDPTRAPNPDLNAEWNGILSQFSEQYGLDPFDFAVTSYEAGMVVHSALRSLLQGRQQVPPAEQLRQELLEALEVQSFDAVEPWRKIEFIDGRLTEPHTAPIYRIGRGRLREDESESRAWVEIAVEPQFSYMEGPIRIRLRGHSTESARVLLSRVENGQSRIIRSRDVAFSASEAVVDFHVFRTGLYRVSIEGADYTPSFAQTELTLMPTYMVSVVTALLGAMLVVLREPANLRARVLRILLGGFAGFALTFSALYGTEVAGWIPFPKFGDEPYVNAIVTGLIGGLVGPHVLAEIFLSWALTLSIRHRNSGRARDIPEGL